MIFHTDFKKFHALQSFCGGGVLFCASTAGWKSAVRTVAGMQININFVGYGRKTMKLKILNLNLRIPFYDKTANFV